MKLISYFTILGHRALGLVKQPRNITTSPCAMRESQHLFPDIAVYGGEHIHLGVNVSFNNFCHLTATSVAPIEIGDDVLVGPHVIMNTGDHGCVLAGKKIREQPAVREGIKIGSDVWIAARVTILRGARIPDGCVIGACSLVTRHDKLEPNGVYVGSPLRKIRERI